MASTVDPAASQAATETQGRTGTIELSMQRHLTDGAASSSKIGSYLTIDHCQPWAWPSYAGGAYPYAMRGRAIANTKYESIIGVLADDLSGGGHVQGMLMLQLDQYVTKIEIGAAHLPA
jgi:hypothetical protein